MFTPGTLYIRAHLHTQFGGQRQGGISTPARFPIILLFTGEAGKQYGCQDRTTDAGVFLYTGEGQRGDMTFTKGNLAIRDHTQNGEDLHLFEYQPDGRVQAATPPVGRICGRSAGFPSVRARPAILPGSIRRDENQEGE